MNMKLDEKLSIGNVITILVLLVSVISSWGMMNQSINSINTRLDQKSDKQVVDTKFQFIQQDLSEIKEMIKEIK